MIIQDGDKLVPILRTAGDTFSDAAVLVQNLANEIEKGDVSPETLKNFVFSVFEIQKNVVELTSMLKP